MPTNIAALPPPTHHGPPNRIITDGSDVPEYNFKDLWQNKEEGLTFGDVLDIINPLQHIPIISTIYRMATGDEVGMGSRIAGGALFGGPLGILVSGLTAIMEEASGGSIEEHIATAWDALTGDDDAEPPIASIEHNQPAPTVLSSAPDGNAEQAVPRRQPADITATTIAAQQIATNVSVAPSVVPEAVPFSPRPYEKPPVTVSPMTAIHRIQSPRQTTASHAPDRSAEDQRIAQAIEQAQRAQAALLMAHTGSENEVQVKSEEPRTPSTTYQPFSAHPYMLPRGAPPELISRAMEQAMAKYQAALQQRNEPIQSASPPTADVPAR